MIVVSKSKPLKGTVNICGAKNAALPIMAASLAVDGCVTLENMPRLSDTENMGLIIESLGGIVDMKNHMKL
jgi:UDP-N-acetylglucosamine 1-carboxyvinyltransferase